MQKSKKTFLVTTLAAILCLMACTKKQGDAADDSKKLDNSASLTALGNALSSPSTRHTNPSTSSPQILSSASPSAPGLIAADSIKPASKKHIRRHRSHGRRGHKHHGKRSHKRHGKKRV